MEDTVIYTTQKVPGSTWRVVGVSYIDETVNESFWQMTRVVLLASALILVAAFVVAYVLSRSLSRPLQQLENAMEACSRMAQGPKFVHLDGSVRSGVLTVTMDNSFDGRVTRENGAYRSSKRSDLGVGLASIQAVAQKHRGNARFEPDGTVFRSSGYLQI